MRWSRCRARAASIWSPEKVWRRPWSVSSASSTLPPALAGGEGGHRLLHRRHAQPARGRRARRREAVGRCVHHRHRPLQRRLHGRQARARAGRARGADPGDDPARGPVPRVRRAAHGVGPPRRRHLRAADAHPAGRRPQRGRGAGRPGHGAGRGRRLAGPHPARLPARERRTWSTPRGCSRPAAATRCASRRSAIHQTRTASRTSRARFCPGPTPRWPGRPSPSGSNTRSRLRDVLVVARPVRMYVADHPVPPAVVAVPVGAMRGRHMMMAAWPGLDDAGRGRRGEEDGKERQYQRAERSPRGGHHAHQDTRGAPGLSVDSGPGSCVALQGRSMARESAAAMSRRITTRMRASDPERRR